MNKIKKMIPWHILFLLVLATTMGKAQGIVDVGQQVDHLIAQMPAYSPAHLDRTVNELLLLGPAGISHLMRRLGDVDDNDNDARQLISGLAKTLGRLEASEQRLEIESRFNEYLMAEKPPRAAQTFVLNQLQFFATDVSVAPLSKLVTDICFPVVRVLTTIGSDAALAALVKAAPKVPEECNAAILKACVEIGGTCVELATPMVKSSDVNVRAVARQTLISQNPDQGFDILSTLYKEGDHEVAPDLLALLDLQARHGQVDKLRSGLNFILKHNPSQHTLTQVAHLAGTHLGTKSLSFLNRALKASDDQTASKIIGVLSDQADIPLEPFLKDAQRFPLNAQVALVSVAEKRGDRSALGLVRRLLSSRDAGAQAYGLHALSSLSGEASLGELLAFVKQAKNGLSAAAAAEEIGRYVGAHNLQIVPDALHQSTPHGKVALINLMADRKMSQFFNTVSDLAGSGETEVADAIFSKLTSLSKGVQMSKLIHLIPQAKDEMHVNNLVQALTHRYSASEGDRKMLMQTFEESTTAEIAGRTMAAIGDEDLLVYLNQRMLETGGYPNHARRSILHWSQPNALPTLLGLVQSKDEEVGRDAGAQAVRLTRQQNSTQRLLTLRRLLQVCDVASVRQQAIGELGRTYTIPAVRFLSSFLQDTVLSSAAAGALIRIGQEAASNPMPLGAEDHEAMSAAVKLLGEEVNPYAAAELRSLLDAGPMEKPFRSLFNGQNLDGWQGLVQNPIARSKMSMAERKAAQSTADSIMHLSWFVENGEIRFEGDGYDNLCTAVESFQDFELYMDWKIEKDGDSGVYLRGSPQIQIWDPDRENAGSGSGGLFNNQVHTKEPSHRADNPVGEWNTFRILMIDNKVTVYLNGELVTDHVILENYWDREQRIFRRGPIELQAHTTPLAFRDLFIREIEGAAQLNSGEQQDGFTHLYNGVNLDGWIGNTTDYVSEDGEIVIYPTLSGGSGNLMTEKEYSNFILRFEFLLTPGANNGLGIHAPMKGDAAYLGKELQILDNTAEIYAKLKPYQYHGSAYGIAPAKRGFQRPIGEWNMQEVEVRGNKIKVTLNNEVILDADLDALSADGTMDGRDHPGLKKLKGHIGFLGHGSEVRFRNIRIKELVD